MGQKTDRCWALILIIEYWLRNTEQTRKKPLFGVSCVEDDLSRALCRPNKNTVRPILGATPSRLIISANMQMRYRNRLNECPVFCVTLNISSSSAFHRKSLTFFSRITLSRSDRWSPRKQRPRMTCPTKRSPSGSPPVEQDFVWVAPWPRRCCLLPVMESSWASATRFDSRMTSQWALSSNTCSRFRWLLSTNSIRIWNRWSSCDPRRSRTRSPSATPRWRTTTGTSLKSTDSIRKRIPNGSSPCIVICSPITASA